MAVWRLQVNTGGANIAEYCLKNHVAATGWSLDHLSVEKRAQLSTFNDYYAIAKDEYKTSTVFTGWLRMLKKAILYGCVHELKKKYI